MPRIRRRPRRRNEKFAELDRHQRRHLLLGCPLLQWKGFKTRDEFEDAWELHRDGLMEEFVRESPGHRPFAWWLCDHCKERPIVLKEKSKWAWTTERRERHDSENPHHFGFLHTSHFYGPEGYLQQSETDYLREHGLLTEDELESLEKGLSK